MELERQYYVQKIITQQKTITKLTDKIKLLTKSLKEIHQKIEITSYDYETIK